MDNNRNKLRSIKRTRIIIKIGEHLGIHSHLLFPPKKIVLYRMFTLRINQIQLFFRI